MSYIHRLTPEAAIYVAAHLRPDDHREVTEGHGCAPIRAAWRPFDADDIYFTVPNGETAGMAGVETDGRIFMLCTPAIDDYPILSLEKRRSTLIVDQSLCFGI